VPVVFALEAFCGSPAAFCLVQLAVISLAASFARSQVAFRARDSGSSPLGSEPVHPLFRGWTLREFAALRRRASGALPAASGVSQPRREKRVALAGFGGPSGAP